MHKTDLSNAYKRFGMLVHSSFMVYVILLGFVASSIITQHQSDVFGSFTSTGSQILIDTGSEVAEGDEEEQIQVQFTNQNFTIAAAPEGVSSGLEMWLDAQDSSTLYQDLGCSTQVTTNNDSVQCWQDKSGSGHNVAEATNNPNYFSSGIGSQPAVKFDSVDYLTETGSSLSDDSVYTKLVVFQYDGISGNNLVSSDSSGSGTIGMWGNSSSSNVFMYHGSNILSATNVTSAGTPTLAVLRYGAGGLSNQIRIDGTLEAQNTTIAGYTASSIQIGGYNEMNLLDGRIGEVLVYSQALSDNDIQTLECFLSEKWSITLPYSCDTPGLWTNEGGDNLFSNPLNWDDGIVPTSLIDVTLDSSETNDNLIIDQNVNVNSFIVNSGYSGNVTNLVFDVAIATNLDTNGGNLSLGSGTWTVGGNVDMADVTSLNSGTSNLIMTGAGTLTLLASGQIYDLNINNASNTVQLGSDLILNSINIHSSSTFDSALYDIDVNGEWMNSGTFIAGTNAVNLVGNDQGIYGSNTFYDLAKNVTTADELTFESGATQNITNNLSLTGIAGNLLTINSTSSGVQATINPTGTQTLSFLDVVDNNSSVSIIANDSIDSGNNTNWLFSSIPQISNIVTTPNLDGFTITWDTDILASSQIEYGLTSSLGSSTTEINTAPRVTSHVQTISGLISCTTYDLKLVVRDAGLQVGESANYSATTSGCEGNANVENNITSNIILNGAGGSVGLAGVGNGLDLNVPTGYSLACDAFFQIKDVSVTQVVTSTGTPVGKSASQIYELSSYCDPTTEITTFSNPIEVTISYSNSDIFGINETTLQIYRWDGAAWNVLPNCVVDTGLDEVTCETSNFSVFGLFGDTLVTSSGGGGSSINSSLPPLVTDVEIEIIEEEIIEEELVEEVIEEAQNEAQNTSRGRSSGGSSSNFAPTLIPTIIPTLTQVVEPEFTNAPLVPVQEPVLVDDPIQEEEVSFVEDAGVVVVGFVATTAVVAVGYSIAQGQALRTTVSKAFKGMLAFVPMRFYKDLEQDEEEDLEQISTENIKDKNKNKSEFTKNDT